VELMQATDNEHALSDIKATIAALRASGSDGQAAIGYCFGGRLSFQTAAAGLVDVAIAYYGGGIQNKLDLADQIKVPLLMHFGGQDSHIPPEAVQQIAVRFEDRQDVEIHLYPGAEHGFNCTHRDSYQQRAAALAHGNSLIFPGGKSVGPPRQAGLPAMCQPIRAQQQSCMGAKIAAVPGNSGRPGAAPGKPG
jgi:carboxymethylenebutenolidase